MINLQGGPSLTPPDSPQPAKRQRLTSPQASAEPAASPAASDKAASIECAHLHEVVGMPQRHDPLRFAREGQFMAQHLCIVLWH